jgi:Viral BACON domain/Secretion system C-terminal sorting domain
MKKTYILLITLLLCFEGWGQTEYALLKTGGYKCFNLKTFNLTWTYKESFGLYYQTWNDKNLFYTAFPNASNEDVDRRGKLCSINLKDGKKNWEIRITGLTWGSTIISDDNNIYTWVRNPDDNKYYIVALDVINGTELWRVHGPIVTLERTIGKMMVKNNKLYFTSFVNGRLFLNALNISDHKILWAKEIWAATSDFLITNENIVLITNPTYSTSNYADIDWYARAILLDFNGNESDIIKNSFDNIYRGDSEAGIVLNDKIFFRGSRYVAAVDIKSKKELWRRTIDEYCSFATIPDIVEGRFIYSQPTNSLLLSTTCSEIYCLDADNGSIKFKKEELKIYNHSPSLIPYNVYVASTIGIFDIKKNGQIIGLTNGELSDLIGVVNLPSTQPTLNISATAQNAVATATTASITLTTNNVWTASSNTTWLKVNPTSGNAGTNISIKVAIDANTAATARTGVVTFTSGGLTKTYTVTQAGTNGTGLNIDRGINIISPKTNDYFFAANYIPVKAELKESTLGVGFKVGLYPSGSDVPIETSVKIIKISQLSDFTLDLPSTLPNGKYEIRIVNFSNNSINGKVLVEIGNKPDECASQPLNIVNSRKGITIITHGFTPGGEKYGDISSWTDYAKKIRKKISSSNYVDGKGAVIYKNNNDTGIWEKMKIPANEGGNGNVTFDNNGNIDNEIILIYDWKGYSHKPLLPFVAETGIQSGYLEAAADNLFRLLVDSHSDDGKLTSKNIIEKLPVHIIAHSRGNIMMLQTLHRIGKYFPKIIIEQFTALDPHPATSFGDVAYKQAGTVSSLPGLTNKIVDGCKYTIGCGDAMDIQLLMPFNVKYAENYFRRDGIYEGGINISSSAYYNLNFKIFAGSFDGIPVNGINTNNELDEGKIAIYSDILGGSHSGVVNWYFGTLNSENINKDEALNQRNVIDWYGAKGALKNNPKCRFSSGYYFSRNGGASDSEMSNLKPFKTISVDEMDKQLEKRPRCYNDNCTSKPLTYLGILNGNFEYGNNSGWWGNGGDMSDKTLVSILNTDNSHNYALFLENTTGVANKYFATHSNLHFPSNFNYLELSIFMNDDELSKASPENSVKVIFFDKFSKEFVATTSKIKADKLWHKYSITIPNELKGKTGRFRIEFVSNIKNSSNVLVDNIQFGNIKQSGVVINENSSKSLSIFPNPTTNQFSIDLKDIEGKAQILTIIDEKGTIIAQKAVDETCCENIQVDFPQTGVYSIIIQTDKGTVSKKININK